MAQQGSVPTTSSLSVIHPRWTGLGFGMFATILLVYELALMPGPINWQAPTLWLLLAFVCAAPLTGVLLVPRTRWQWIVGQALMVIDAALALSLIGLRCYGLVACAVYTSPFWIALLIPMLAALLLMPHRSGIGIAVAIWLGYGALMLIDAADTTTMYAAAATWLLHTAIVWLVLLLLDHIISGQDSLRLRARRREQALHNFLAVSNKLRASTNVQTILEEVATAVQAAGDFDCVTLSRVEWREGKTRVVVAIGASGRRLTGVEGLVFPWEDFATLIDPGLLVGVYATMCETLPFRRIRNEQHLVLPLVGQFGEIYGLLTVSVARNRRAGLYEALPLLELLANQAAAALDNTSLFTTLEERVQQATIDLETSAHELRRARDRAEVLYHIARALSVTLDERQVLERALALVAQSTGAERGGIMLVDAETGRLVFRTTMDQRKMSDFYALERDEGLAIWVLTHRQMAILPDTTTDDRWQVHSPSLSRFRSALAVPILLEQEPLGVLILLHSAMGHFNDDHAQLAMAAASQAAVALAKAQLYRYVSEQSDRLSVSLRQREEEASKSMAIVQSIADGVIVGDRMGRIRLINAAAERILGINAALFLGRALGDLPGAPQEDDPATVDRLHQITLGERTVRAHFAPVVSSSGEWLGSVVVYHDITREVLADKLKNEFVATASHELRTPLTSIRGYVDMLRLGTFGSLSEAQHESLNIIKNNVGRLVELVDELLDMTRAEAGETRLRREKVNVGDMLREVTQSLDRQFSERGITLDLDIHEPLPMVLADRQRLQQIIFNLLGNACKYTRPGGRVDVALRNGQGELRVDIRDTGVGIPTESQPHIFTPFYRADNPLRDEVGGTGLGLSITRKLVELHGGRIWFVSTEGQGSTFSFTLPLDKEQ